MKVNIYGKEVAIINNNLQFWSKVDNGTWEQDTFKIFDRFLDQEHSYIDVGAWIGPTAMYGMRISKHCHAIEPDNQAFDTLKHNIALNQRLGLLMPNITLHHLALWKHEGMVKLYHRKQGDSLSSVSYQHEGKFNLIESITLENFINKNNIKDCNFIKIDIEGGEVVLMPNIIRLLRSLNITIHLSLHPHLFNDLVNDSCKIIESVSIYDFVYSSKGKIMSIQELSDLLNHGKSFDVVISNQRW